MDADLKSARWLTEVVQNELNTVVKALQNERMVHALSRSELAEGNASQTRTQVELEGYKERLAAYVGELDRFRDLVRGTAALQEEKDEVLREAEFLQMQLQEARDEVAALDGKLEEAFDTKVCLELDLVNISTDLCVLQEKLTSELAAEDALSMQLETSASNVVVLQEKLDAMFEQSTILKNTIECTKQDAINIQTVLARACHACCTMYDLILESDSVQLGTCGLRMQDHVVDASFGQNRVEWVVSAVELFSMHRVDVGDVVLEINGRALGQMSLSEVKEHLCGSVGSEAIILIRSKKLSKEVTVTLMRIPDTSQLDDFFWKVHSASEGVKRMQTQLADGDTERELVKRSMSKICKAHEIELCCIEERSSKLVQEHEGLLVAQEMLTEHALVVTNRYKHLQDTARESSTAHQTYERLHRQEQSDLADQSLDICEQYADGLCQIESLVAVLVDQTGVLLKERDYLHGRWSGEMEVIDQLTETIKGLAKNGSEGMSRVESLVRALENQTVFLLTERDCLRGRCSGKMEVIDQLTETIKGLAENGSMSMSRVESLVGALENQTLSLFQQCNHARESSTAHQTYERLHRQEQSDLADQSLDICEQYADGLYKMESVVAVLVDQTGVVLKERDYLHGKWSGEMEVIDQLTETIKGLAENGSEGMSRVESLVRALGNETSSLCQKYAESADESARQNSKLENLREERDTLTKLVERMEGEVSKAICGLMATRQQNACELQVWVYRYSTLEDEAKQLKEQISNAQAYSNGVISELGSIQIDLQMQYSIVLQLNGDLNSSLSKEAVTTEELVAIQSRFESESKELCTTRLALDAQRDALSQTQVEFQSVNDTLHEYREELAKTHTALEYERRLNSMLQADLMSSVQEFKAHSSVADSEKLQYEGNIRQVIFHIYTRCLHSLNACIHM